jgi:hypothetical protein
VIPPTEEGTMMDSSSTNQIRSLQQTTDLLFLQSLSLEQAMATSEAIYTEYQTTKSTLQHAFATPTNTKHQST